MNLYREPLDNLPFNPAERDGLWGYRWAEEPYAARLGLGCGAALTLCLATGVGIAPPLDWGAAVVFGLIVAVFTRGFLLALHRLRRGGWRSWRQREVNLRALDLVSGGGGFVLALILVTGGGGVGPAFAPGMAIFIGLLTVIASRALLLLMRWP